MAIVLLLPACTGLSWQRFAVAAGYAAAASSVKKGMFVAQFTRQAKRTEIRPYYAAMKLNASTPLL